MLNDLHWTTGVSIFTTAENAYSAALGLAGILRGLHCNLLRRGDEIACETEAIT